MKNTGDALLHKTIAISGSTGGLGKALCRHIAAAGGNIIMLDRSKDKTTALRDELKKEFPKISTCHIPLDLEDFESVKNAAKSLLKSPPDYLLLNAGAYSIPRHKTSLGFDNVFQINCLSPYYLARQILPEIEKKGGKIIAVGSIAHNYSKTDESDIDFSKQTRASRVYGNAKRRLMFSLWNLDNPAIAVAHPGITFTGITAHYPKLIFAIIKHPMKIIFMKPKKAALPIMRAFSEKTEKNEWLGPGIFSIWGAPKKQTLNTCSAEEQAKIAAAMEQIYNEILNK